MPNSNSNFKTMKWQCTWSENALEPTIEHRSGPGSGHDVSCRQRDVYNLKCMIVLSLGLESIFGVNTESLLSWYRFKKKIKIKILIFCYNDFWSKVLQDHKAMSTLSPKHLPPWVCSMSLWLCFWQWLKAFTCLNFFPIVLVNLNNIRILDFEIRDYSDGGASTIKWTTLNPCKKLKQIRLETIYINFQFCERNS